MVWHGEGPLKVWTHMNQSHVIQAKNRNSHLLLDQASPIFEIIRFEGTALDLRISDFYKLTRFDLGQITVLGNSGKILFKSLVGITIEVKTG
ncbi:hypothetical protein Glove_606g27 [Diversispora epigaea]|uniref:Uncharacterized protein n=1 Tax=Diversispora epigaea TaxID=1348612 RepID=A0A397G792_9GLOM|nr:hypothetical protein Glove_606g27 [Diversispora epigaea]